MKTSKKFSSFQELNQEREAGRVDEAKRRREEEAKKQQAKFDLETYSYTVMIGGKVEHTTPHVQEAINLAKTIGAKVWWCIEGTPVSEISLK